MPIGRFLKAVVPMSPIAIKMEKLSRWNHEIDDSRPEKSV